MLPYTCANHPAQQDMGYPKGKAPYSKILHVEETPKADSLPKAVAAFILVPRNQKHEHNIQSRKSPRSNPHSPQSLNLQNPFFQATWIQINPSGLGCGPLKPLPVHTLKHAYCSYLLCVPAGHCALFLAMTLAVIRPEICNGLNSYIISSQLPRPALKEQSLAHCCEQN